MNKSNLSNRNYNKRISENNKNTNYVRCASVEEKYINSRVSHNLEKEFLDVTYLVKNSVEKINTLFNNKEFKQKTLSKKLYNNLSNRININRYDFNKEIDEDKNRNSKNNTLKSFINTLPRENDKKFSKYSVNEEDEYIYNNNDLYEELKDLNSNKIKNNNNFHKNKYSSKSNMQDNDSINNSLLNLESNKLYHKDQNVNLKKITISENANFSQKNKDKKYKNPFSSKYLKTDNQNDLIGPRDKKKDISKYVQKGNKSKKTKQNNVDGKTRNTNKPKVFYEKYIVEESNKLSNTQKLKNPPNASLQKESLSGKRNNSNSMLIDINYNINTDSNCLNANNNNNNISNNNSNNNDKKQKKDDNKLLLSIDKHLYKGQKRAISINDIGKMSVENTKKKPFFSPRNKKNSINNQNTQSNLINQNTQSNLINQNSQNNEIIINTKSPNKIKTKDFMKMMLLLNEYLITNNLFEDYSNPDNKKLIDNYSSFLASNITTDYTSKDNNLEKDKMLNAAIKIQRKWRKKKFETYLINNFGEENEELKKMLINEGIQNSKNKDDNNIELINNIINNYYLIYNNIEDIDKMFFNIQAIIQRKLTVNEKNILYKDYINKIIFKK